MTIALRLLLKMANFPLEEVDNLLSKEEFLTNEEKFELVESAWYLISQKYYSTLNFEKMQIYKEIEEGKRKYNPNDFEELKARLTYEISQKLEAAENDQSMEEVRKNLEQYLPSENKDKTQPFPQR